MRDDPTDLGRTLRRLLELRAVRRAADRARESDGESLVPPRPLSGPEFPTSRVPRGDWDRYLVPGPEGIH